MSKQPPESDQTILCALRPEFYQPEIIKWAALLDNLRSISHDQNAGFKDPDAPAGFDAAELSLGAVLEYLCNVPGLLKEGALVPLFHLSAALRDLSEGRKPPLLVFEPRKNPDGGRPTTQYRRSRVIGFAARCMDELVEAGDTIPDAAKKVIAAMGKGKALGWQKATWKTIKNWRERCKEGDGGAVSSDALNRYLEPLPPEFGNTPTLRAKCLLQVLSEANRRGLGE